MACTENENHVESSRVEDEEEERRDAAAKTAELPACFPFTPPNRHQASWQGQLTPAEMSQGWGGNTGMWTLFLTFIYSGKACWTRSLFFKLVRQTDNRSPHLTASIQLHCILLKFTCLSHLNILKNEGISDSFLRQISPVNMWIEAGVLPATNHMARLYCVRTMVLNWCS